MERFQLQHRPQQEPQKRRQSPRRLLVGVVCLCVLWLSWGTTARADNGPALFRQGRKALAKGQYYQATKLLRSALKTLSHWGLVHLELARAMQFNGEPGEAILKHLHLAMAALPQNPRVQLLAGQLYEARGAQAKALRHYLRAVKLNHYAPTACLRASGILITKGKGAQAIACLRKLQNKRPLPTNLHLLLARAYQQANRWPEAGQHWSKALARRPKSLTMLRKVFFFYKQNLPQQPASLQRQWRRTIYQLQRRLRKLLPRKKYRRLRPLLPSKR